MEIQNKIPLLEEILGEYRSEIGDVFEGYKNHVYRMIHFCLALGADRDADMEKLVIAGAFQDLGLFTENTVDYLPPSILLARSFLKKTGREAMTREVELMIDMHHKLTPYRDRTYPLVEIFRRVPSVLRQNPASLRKASINSCGFSRCRPWPASSKTMSLLPGRAFLISLPHLSGVTPSCLPQ